MLDFPRKGKKEPRNTRAVRTGTIQKEEKEKKE